MTKNPEEIPEPSLPPVLSESTLAENTLPESTLAESEPPVSVRRASAKKDTGQLAVEITDALPEDDLEVNPALESILEQRELVDRLRYLPIWLLSFSLHVVLMIFLAMHYLGDNKHDAMELISQPADEAGVDMEDLSGEDLEIGDFTMETFEMPPQVVDQPIPTAVTELETTAEPVLDSMLADASAELIEPVSAMSVGALSGRMEGKGMMLKSGGGSNESEKAVQLALEWLARHQLPNGSWSLKLSDCPQCGGKCQNSGSTDAPNAATALALLPFLGAGHTPTKGKYRQTVAQGINFLLQNGVRSSDGYDMRDSGGRMYAHGLATIVFCEACAMGEAENRGRYKDLLGAAQAALNFIEYAQDPNEGGWRYAPREAGDTSVVGWQLMALRSGDTGGLAVQPIVLQKTLNFLVNKVANSDQTEYGYTAAGGGSIATTAIGLLCRLFLDWSVQQPALLAGADALLAKGPAFGNPYYMYYATQLFHHIGGQRWKAWNGQVRDQLIAMQVTEGEMAGSWFPTAPDPHSLSAGRLYVTALYCMTLEVYYRHMPLYQLQGKQQQEAFPID